MSFLRSVAKVGGYTTISRVLGFVRDQLIAFTLGTGMVADAFFVAQRFPNLFRTLFAEGAFNSAFVPLFAKKIEADGKEKAHQFASEVFAVLLTWMILFCSVCIILMPWLIYIFAWGFQESPEKMALVITLTQLCFPYLMFMSLTALQGGVLNSVNKFTAAAAAPILLNVVLISSNVVAWYLGTGNSSETGYIFAIGVTLSGIAQYVLMAFACNRAGFRFIPKWPRLTPEVKQVVKRSLPGIVSGGVMQINLLIATSIASGIAHANSYLYYADRLYQLPLGIIGVAVGVVLLPTLSKLLRAGETQKALTAKNRALEFSLFLTLPAAAALMVIAGPILHTVFEHGAFTQADTEAVVPVVIAFAIGLPAYSLTKVFQPSFYAREDTKTPMRFAINSVIVNVIASLILTYYLSYIGIAIATSIAAWTNAAQLYFRLRKLGHFSFDERSKKRLPLIILCAFIMAAVLYGSSNILRENFTGANHFMHALWSLLVLVTAGIGSYFIAAQVTGAFRISELKAAFKR